MKTQHLSIVLIALAITIANCSKSREIEGSYSAQKTIKNAVVATLETDPVAAATDVDAADDPAIWLHPTNPAKSIIIGTDKKSGLSVYDLNGKLLHFYATGAMNNVDVRYNFACGSDTFDIAAASNIVTNTIDVFRINKTNGALVQINDQPIVSQLDKIYGFCLYQSPTDSLIYAFVNSKTGQIEQWQLQPAAQGTTNGKLVRQFALQSQVEGMVADDANQTLFIGEENVGIWRFNAQPTPTDTTRTLLTGSTQDNPNIVFDIEGLALYRARNNAGYLIASSQGNFSYAIFNRTAPHAYLGSFYISDGTIDGVEETDGLDVINSALNPNFPHGMLVVQDGINKDADTKQPQNFKYIDWAKIANSFTPPLLIDTLSRVR